jgi:hypothetical protein
MKLYLPNPTDTEKKEAFERIHQLSEQNKNWRSEYLKQFPEMDNSTGIAKLNNFLYRKIFDADLFRSLEWFFNPVNK